MAQPQPAYFPANDKVTLDQLERLARLALAAERELSRLTQEIQTLEAELEEFLCDYQRKLGDVLPPEGYPQDSTAAMQLANRGESMPGGGEVAAPAAHSPRPEAGAAALTKRIFRTLAKRLHPDSAGGNGSHRLFTRLCEAYEQGDIPALLDVGRQARLSENEQLTGEARAEALLKHYDRVLEWLKTLREQQRSLLASPAWQLKTRIFHARLCGQDLMGAIRKNLSSAAI